MKELSEQLLCAPCSLDERSLPKTPWSRWAAQVGMQIEKRRRPDTTWSTERRLEFIGRHWDRSDTERRREELNRVPRTEPPAERGPRALCIGMCLCVPFVEEAESTGESVNLQRPSGGHQTTPLRQRSLCLDVPFALPSLGPGTAGH